DYPPSEKRIIDSEGSRYTDGIHPFDPGGPTRWGITLTDARLHWKKNATTDDVRFMPLSVALQIYKSKYWDVMNCDAIPAGLDYTVMDYGVNSGIGRSGRVLRQLVGLPTNTSAITAEVVAAVAKRDVKALIHAMNTERLNFLQSLKIWPIYKNGWTTRVRGVDSFSEQLAANPAIAATAPTIAPTKPVLPGATEGPPPASTVAPEIPDDGTVKGMHTPPDATKKTIAGTATATAAGSGYIWLDWVHAHTGATAVIVVCGIVLVSAIIKIIHDNFEAKQNAPMPGTGVVPELLVKA
ncbi:MAG: glycoside hydrolase family 108 protein, partial [Minisyncoccia bacterium]